MLGEKFEVTVRKSQAVKDGDDPSHLSILFFGGGTWHVCRVYQSIA